MIREVRTKVETLKEMGWGYVQKSALGFINESKKNGKYTAIAVLNVKINGEN